MFTGRKQITQLRDVRAGFSLGCLEDEACHMILVLLKVRRFSAENTSTNHTIQGK